MQDVIAKIFSCMNLDNILPKNPVVTHYKINDISNLTIINYFFLIFYPLYNSLVTILREWHKIMLVRVLDFKKIIKKLGECVI